MFKKTIVLTMLFVAITSAADVAPWQLSLDLSLHANLNTYTKNWVGGNAGSFAWSSQLKASASKQLTKSLRTDNQLKLEFGETHVQNSDSKKWLAPQKTNDLIDFSTTEIFTIGGWLEPYVSARAVSQFDDQRDRAMEHYGNPLTFTESFGAARDLYNSADLKWNIHLGAASRQAIDRFSPIIDATTKAIISREKKVVYDGGLEVVSDFKTMTKDNRITFASLIRAYEALLSSESEKAGTDDWRYPHLDWQNDLGVNIAKYIMVKMSVQLLYDREIDVDPRLKSVASVGVTVALKNAK